MAMGRIHTDLALETKEKFEEDNVEIRGVEIQEDYDEKKDIRKSWFRLTGYPFLVYKYQWLYLLYNRDTSF